MASASASGKKEACPNVLLEAGCMARNVFTVAESVDPPEAVAKQCIQQGCRLVLLARQSLTPRILRQLIVQEVLLN
eukprot:6177417-Pleurochrysis_carterae.AAC.4